MRARGLKLALKWLDTKPNLVAPHAGAWIETQNLEIYAPWVLVAPHAGAWIETIPYRALPCSSLSRAPCGRVD